MALVFDFVDACRRLAGACSRERESAHWGTYYGSAGKGSFITGERDIAASAGEGEEGGTQLEG